MTLIDVDGRSWTLSVLDYEFPRAGPRSDKWDRNWVRVRLRWEDGTDSWERSDPALTTWDVRELVRWLRGHLIGTIEFLEPSLAFERVERTSLAMLLDHGLRPPASAQWTDAGDTSAPVKVEFHSPPSDFVAAALSLAATAKEYPPR